MAESVSRDSHHKGLAVSDIMHDDDPVDIAKKVPWNVTYPLDSRGVEDLQEWPQMQRKDIKTLHSPQKVHKPS